MTDEWRLAMARFDRAARHGFTVDAMGPRWAPYAPKSGSHDDGPFGGPFLGGIGGPNFSRNVLGAFDRWHLDPGIHAHQEIAGCFLAISWLTDGVPHGRKLLIGDGGFTLADRRYAALFPIAHELYAGALPFRLLLESWSPAVPGDLAAAELPVTFFDVAVADVAAGVSDITVALFWTNLLGWTPFAQSSEHRTGRLWPAHTNAGNHNVALDLGPATAALAFRRAPAGAPTPANLAETVIAVVGTAPTRELSYMADVASTGEAPHDQRYTLAHVAHRFLTTGALPGEELSWQAHWHEPLGGAVAATVDPAAPARFVVVNDWPRVRFGAGREWRRRYSAAFGADGRAGAALARHALDHAADWRAALDRWQDATIATFAARRLPPRIAGAALNELSFVAGGGGTAWVVGDDDGPLAAPTHFGLLEGWDTGYHYYNTSDLWVYAFAAVTRHWPELAESVFADYLASIPLALPATRPTYRYHAIAPLLVAGKIPHDLGAPPDDPWFRLNGYAMRDDPNLWKDHNPAFVVAFMLHASLADRAITHADYAILRAAAGFTLAQTATDSGVPEHGEFGDSTWDALNMVGFSTYTAALCLAMWTGLARLADTLGEGTDAAGYRTLADQAATTLNCLWNGDYFVVNDRGKYRGAVMADALWGVYYARLIGLGDLVDSDRVRSHLRAVHRLGFKAFDDGLHGPLLVSEPGRQRYDRDGGEELQTNEVIVGAAWMYVAMAAEYGLHDEAAEVATALRDTIYGGSGLQFRTPAAWNGRQQYRAPLNMRPLAIWLLALGER